MSYQMTLPYTDTQHLQPPTGSTHFRKRLPAHKRRAQIKHSQRLSRVPPSFEGTAPHSHEEINKRVERRVRVADEIECLEWAGTDVPARPGREVLCFGACGERGVACDEGAEGG
jgi:hypothetical protein